MGKHYLLDTNAVIDYVGDKLPDSAALAMDSLINDDLTTSIIVKIEVLGFDGAPIEMQRLNDFLALAYIIHVDDAIAEKTIHLRKTYKKLKLGDALIAATALVHELTVLTRNTKDFQLINGLACVNPHDL